MEALTGAFAAAGSASQPRWRLIAMASAAGRSIGIGFAAVAHPPSAHKALIRCGGSIPEGDFMKKELRPAIASGQGIPVSEADAQRIADLATGGEGALAKAMPGSLFDTEPAHFERLMLQGAKENKS
jgi:1,6-anhydro-N-acetylmuramate kinase